MVNTPMDDLLNTAQRKHAGPRIPSGPRSGSVSPRTAGSRLSSGHTSPSGQQITTLQVKREDGSKVYIIRLRCVGPNRSGRSFRLNSGGSTLNSRLA
jgi:hypothetical protein